MQQSVVKKSDNIFTPILIASSLVLFLSFMIRASFGVFQIPIASDLGWLRSDFSLAIAIQNLAWGLATPLFGAFAERLGDRRAILIGIGFYAAGLLFSAYSVSSFEHQFLEVLVGFGIAGTGFGVLLGVVGRAASDKHRSLALGIYNRGGQCWPSCWSPFWRNICCLVCIGQRFLSSLPLSSSLRLCVCRF